jgi:hypothetical protein
MYLNLTCTPIGTGRRVRMSVGLCREPWEPTTLPRDLQDRVLIPRGLAPGQETAAALFRRCVSFSVLVQNADAIAQQITVRARALNDDLVVLRTCMAEASNA